MDDKLFEEMLREIDAMTKEEYLALYNEAQRLPDFLTDWESISIPIAPGGEIFSSNISFSIDYKGPFEPLQSNYYFEGDIICLQAA